MSKPALLAGLATALVALQSAVAQTEPAGQTAGQPVVTLQLPDQPDRPEVDETALRRYAEQGDFARVDAEVRRLQSLFPDWIPPNDLYGAPPPEDGSTAVDVSYLWAVYQAGDMAAVNDEIAILKRLNPGWQPPAELTRQVNAAQTKQLLAGAAEIEDWQGIARFHQANPTQFACEDVTIESIWIAAEAYAKLGQADASEAIYAGAIEGCRSADLRLSSLQKAMASLKREPVARLIAMEEGKYRTAASQARFTSIKSDWQGDPGSAGRNAAASRFGKALRAAGSGSIEPDELNWLQGYVGDNRDDNGAMVLGWYHFNRDDMPNAERWFESSMSWRANAKAAEGLGLVYTRQNRPEEAEQIALAWADRVDGLGDMLDSARLQQVWNAINADRPGDALALTRRILEQSPEHAETILAQGWALLALRRSSEARLAFEQLLAKRSVSEEIETQAAHGVALAAIDRGDVGQARRMMADHAFTRDMIDDIEREVLRQEVAQAFNRGAYQEAYIRLEMLRNRWPDYYKLDEMEGWTLYHLKRYEEALDIFKAVYAANNSSDANAGITAAQLQIFGFD